jgi:hypothetical protein
VDRLQGLRGVYGIAAPAPLCADPAETAAGDQVTCQVLEAPHAPGERLVPEGAARAPAPGGRPSGDGEIRLTYGELTALIADAIKDLRR